MSLAKLAKQVARELIRCDSKVVLAESCTGGLVAATLTRVPGISAHLCGSAVTYRNETKYHWLGVPRRSLRSPGPVSEVVAREMVTGALKATPEADLAAAVTGHLGPNAPPGEDALVFIGVGQRASSQLNATVRVHPLRLQAATRLARQREAAERVLGCLQDALAGRSG